MQVKLYGGPLNGANLYWYGGDEIRFSKPPGTVVIDFNSPSVDVISIPHHLYRRSVRCDDVFVFQPESASDV